MRIFFYLLLLLFSISFSGCQYILAALFLQPSSTNERAPVNRVEHVEPGETGLIIIIYNKDKIYGYEGGGIRNGKKYSYGDNSIERFLLYEKMKYGNDLQIHVKSTKDCSDANTDSILKIMSRNGIIRYALENASEYETAFVSKL